MSKTAEGRRRSKIAKLAEKSVPVRPTPITSRMVLVYELGYASYDWRDAAIRAATVKYEREQVEDRRAAYVPAGETIAEILKITGKWVIELCSPGVGESCHLGAEGPWSGRGGGSWWGGGS